MPTQTLSFRLFGHQTPVVDGAFHLSQRRPGTLRKLDGWTLTSLKVFRQVVESGSFVAAAERLDLSNAMVSKHVMSLEQRLGVRLLNRNSRTLSLTESGRFYFERCKTILDDLEAAELELGALDTTPRGTLRVTAPSWAAGLQRMADLLMEYHRRCPDVLVDMSFEDRVVDLVEEGYDLAIRAARPDSLPAGLIARPLRPASFYVAASREYLKRHGFPALPRISPSMHLWQWAI